MVKEASIPGFPSTLPRLEVFDFASVFIFCLFQVVVGLQLDFLHVLVEGGYWADKYFEVLGNRSNSMRLQTQSVLIRKLYKSKIARNKISIDHLITKNIFTNSD